ncbi:hypothetical protein [Kutzneria sp. CA-103260]|uniref:hypothetical protein n=1 Tax=Kutzneria sp. CA-103260 TaxID=2802641 RepID=UPI001BA7C521|nr:hypothetical protein [Kutzneria sp. CA-103260]QUQ70461.1 hypothetical protein JJ691_82400 [Kutzneria sp. CA-103260]
MSRESGSERSQRTVAELLAQYGANSEDSAPRRRRRRADEPTDTAPQAIIDRVLSDSGNLRAIRDDAEETTVGTQPPVRQQPPTPPAATSQQLPKRPVQQPPQPGPQAPPPPPVPQAGPQQQAPVPPAAAPQSTATGMRPPPVRPGAPAAGRTPPPPPRIESSRTNLSRADLPRPSQQQPQPTGYFRPVPPGTPPPVDATADTTHLRPITPDTPPPGNSLANRLAGAPPQEGVTEQLPRIPAAAVGESTQAHPGPLVDDDDDFGVPRAAVPAPPMESTQAHAGPYVDEDDDEYEYDYEAAKSLSYSVDHDAAPAGVGGALAVEDEDAAEEAEGSPGRQWLMMIAQLAVGVVGGAALWLGFQFLWNWIPAAALAAAVVVIVALVIVVRRIRKADDLQTMVLAVLVGLIVTVSPAALRLIGH